MAKENKNTDTEVTSDKKVKMTTNPFPVEELYVDGVAGVLGRGGVFKIDCYRVAGIDKEDKSEVRRVTHRLVLPASAIPELAQAINTVIKSAGKKNEIESEETIQ